MPQETPTFSHAAVAAPHTAATEAGRAILAEGGNAIEAMVAMAATIAVVYPHMNGIGGDGFWLVREPRGRVRYIEAAGTAGTHATIARYKGLGHDTIPVRGPLAALTVPGAIGGWRLALELSAALGGRLPLHMLLANAIGHANGGIAVSRSEAHTAPNARDLLHTAPGFAETYLVDGKTPPAGHMRKLPALGTTLEHLVSAGLADFYTGDIAREISADLERIEAPVTRADLANYAAIERAPLSLALDDATIFNAPPPTQGLAALVILGIFDVLRAEGHATKRDSASHHHALIEATKRAFAVRNRVITDFDLMRHAPADFLTRAALEAEAHAIGMDRAAAVPLPPGKGDTIWMGAVDGSGLAVSYIQSVFWEWGSGCVLPGTGILMQNRGTSFSLDARAANPLMPGRRPFHTLNPAMAVFKDGRVMPYGTMGGDGQPQFQAQIFARYAGYGMGLAEAVDAPRWLLGKTWGAGTTTLKYESRFDETLMRQLEQMGHETEAVNAPYDDGLGHAGALVRHVKGHVEATHDPRSDGGAAGI